MNIEGKNTLFIVSLVLVVLLAVGATTFVLLREHVETEIRDDLGRDHAVFVQMQQYRFSQLAAFAQGAATEPSLLAAVLTADIPTIATALNAYYPRPGVDLMAVYLDFSPSGVTGVGTRPHDGSLQTLHSPALRSLVRQLRGDQKLESGNALLDDDSWMQLVVVPLETPRGRRVGALLMGRRFSAADLHDLRQIISADAVVYGGDRVLLSGLQDLPATNVNPAGPGKDGAGVWRAVDGRHYSVRKVAMLQRIDGKKTPLNLLLVTPYERYWEPYRALGYNALYFSGLILLLAALTGIGISRRTLTRPIQLLARATQAIAKGDMLHKVEVRRNDELGQLGASFNAMLGALSASRRELERSRQRFRDFASSSSDWLWETDRGGHFTFVSSSVSETLEMPAESWLGRTLSEIFPCARVEEFMALLRAGEHSKPQSFKDVEVWVHAPSGVQHSLRLNGVPVFSGDVFKGYRGAVRDITKLKHDEQRMVILANQDHLTGLSNRRRFLQDLALEIRRVENEGRLGVLLLFDLDHLKLVNDTAGHAAGDQIIVQVAGVLRRTSADQDLLARISGDEFALAFASENQQQGMEKARQLLTAINGLRPRFGGRSLNISASVGMVTFPPQGKVPVELLAKADAAICVAKAAGRNRIHLYDETDMMRERMDNQLAWKDRLLAALENDSLVLAFQPIVGVSTRSVHHFEVLVRMREAGGVLIAPGNFIPAAEHFGLIQQVDRQIVTKAIRYLAGLPVGMARVGFSINLSGLSVGSQEMYELIETEVHACGVAPARITFEITETAACEQLNDALEFIDKVRRLGCHVSLDDFGVGFSSFSYLKHLRADTIKIDGSFIREIHHNQADQLFVKALVDVARGLGMRTIAEFVENEQVYRRVSELGVDYVQGYYLGKPQLDLHTRRPRPVTRNKAHESVA